MHMSRSVAPGWDFRASCTLCVGVQDLDVASRGALDYALGVVVDHRVPASAATDGPMCPGRERDTLCLHRSGELLSAADARRAAMAGGA